MHGHRNLKQHFLLHTVKKCCFCGWKVFRSTLFHCNFWRIVLKDHIAFLDCLTMKMKLQQPIRLLGTGCPVTQHHISEDTGLWVLCDLRFSQWWTVRLHYCGNVTPCSLVHMDINKFNIDAWNHAALSLLSSSLVFNYIKIMMYSGIILPVVLYGSATWFLAAREEHKLRVS